MSSTTTTWTTDTNTKSGSATTYTDTVSSLRLVGGEGEDAILRLFADEGDDNADQWRIVSQASTNKLNFMSFASGAWSNVLSIFGSGTAASQYLSIQAGNKLYLDGAGGTTYLQESSDGHLEINVGTTLDMTAPTVDINSSTELNIDTAIYDLNASGAVTLDGATVTIKGTGASKYGDDTATLDFDGSGAVSETGMTSCSITPSGAITLTAGAASTWSTSAGVLTLEGKTGISLKEDGTAAITIDTSRNVGIGVVAPQANLHVNDSTSASEDAGTLLLSNYDASFSDTQTLGSLRFGGTRDNANWGVGATIHAEAAEVWDATDELGTDLVFKTCDIGDAVLDTRMVILSSGNVGIGNTAPGNQLEISKSADDANLELSAWSTTNAHSGAILFQKSSSDTINTAAVTAYVDGTVADERLGNIEARGVDTDSDIKVAAAIRFEQDADATDDSVPGRITFYTSDSDDSGSPTERVRIDDAGNVGIGTDAPAKLLHVNVADLSGFTPEGNTGLVLEANDHVRLEIASPNDKYGTIYFSDQDGRGGQIDYDHANNKMFLGTTASYDMTIDAAGNVGIGTASPDGILEISKDGADADVIISTYDDAVANYSSLILRKADNTEAAPRMVDDNEVLGRMKFEGFDKDANDGSFITGAEIVARINGTPTDDDMPTDLEFWTNDGVSAPEQRMTIDLNGNVGIGTSAPEGLLEVGDISTAAGGTLFKTLDVPEDTATTFYTITGSNLWAGMIEIAWHASDDTNRSGYQLSRFGYDDTFTSITASNQNCGTPTLTLSGNNMQFTLEGAGSSVYRCKFRIMGGLKA